MKKKYSPAGLTALMLAIALTAAPCFGAETVPAETETAETAAPETSVPESDAAASEEETGSFALPEAGSVLSFPEAGITFEWPESFAGSEGVITVYGGEETRPGSGVVMMETEYTAMTPEEFRTAASQYPDGDYTQDASISDASFPLFYVFGINGGRTVDDLSTYLFGATAEQLKGMIWFEEAGSADDFTFFCAGYETAYIGEYLEKFSGPYQDEYTALAENRAAYMEKLSFTAPDIETSNAGAVGETVQFTGTDLATGESVTWEDLFPDNEVTMINLWATWCPPCKAELPDLEQLNQNCREKGGEIIGVVMDILDDPEAGEKALAIMEENGVTYRMILPNEDIYRYLYLDAYPTSYFVDSSGRILAEPVVGANPRAYKLAFDTYLNGAE